MVGRRQRDWWTLLHWSWDILWYTHCVSVPIFPPIHSPTFSTQLSAWRLTGMQHINRAGCPLVPAGLASGEPQQTIWVRKSERKVIISLDLSLQSHLSGYGPQLEITDLSLLDSVGEWEGGMIWEHGIETCIISYMKQIASPGSIQDAWGWCTGTIQRDDTGREERGGFRMGNTCIPVVDACWYMAKPIQYCKVKKLN